MNEELLILGLDPGTNLGYALLNIKGGVLEFKSGKNLSMNFLISKLVEKGKVVIIGTDKSNIPNYVSKVAARLGAKIISPEKDLLVKEKKRLTFNFKFKNRHERDALASAIFAFKKIRNMLRKVDIYLRKNGKKEFSNSVKKILLTKEGFTINRALSSLNESFYLLLH